MQILSQRDKRWANERLNGTYMTVGRWGCTITCLSMLSDHFGDFKTPRYLAKRLRYTKGGKVYWHSLVNHLPFKFEKRLYKKDDAEIKKSLEDPKRAVILEVDHSHWVVCMYRYKFAPHWYRFIDPWFGKKVAQPFSGYKKITGSAHLILK